MKSTTRVKEDLPDLRTRYERLSTPAARQLVDFLSHFEQQQELRCQRVALGSQYTEGCWHEILAELKTLDLVQQRNSTLELEPEVKRAVERWGPGHKQDAAIHQWAQTLASIYFDAGLLLRTWGELGQAQVLADINFILELMASFSYGYAINTPGLRQFRQDVVRLRQLMLERIAVWFEQEQAADSMLQHLQFWASRYGIQSVADSALAALVSAQQLGLALRWQKQDIAAAQMVLSQNGQLLAAADAAGNIWVFAIREDRQLLQVRDSNMPINTMIFSGTDLFVLRGDGKLSSYSIEFAGNREFEAAPVDVVVARQRQLLVVHSLHSSVVTELRLESQIIALNVVGNLVAVADAAGNLFVWEIVGPAGPTIS